MKRRGKRAPSCGPRLKISVKDIITKKGCEGSRGFAMLPSSPSLWTRHIPSFVSLSSREFLNLVNVASWKKSPKNQICRSSFLFACTR